MHVFVLYVCNAYIRLAMQFLCILAKYVNNVLMFTNNAPCINADKKLVLLKNMLPYGFDDMVVNHEKKYIQYDKCCIFFSDIVSYCKLSQRCSNIILYWLLDDLYSRFDNIVKKYENLQKIETIGDAYMVVGNLNNSEYCEKTVVEIIQFSLEIMEEMKKITVESINPLQLRIGIHIGNIIVSTMGEINPRLSIIGRHVNKAARLQATAQPDTIQISSELFDIASKIKKLDVTYVENKNIWLKNIGCVNTFTIKPRDGDRPYSKWRTTT